jgi:hypothetical protein
MNLSSRIEAFVLLGKFLNFFSLENSGSKKAIIYDEEFYSEFAHLISYYHNYNGWFDEVSIKQAIAGITKWLNKETLEKFTEKYFFEETPNPKNIGLVLAGNIPLVGFHDFLCVLLSGNRAIVKQSSNDLHLIPLIKRLLVKVNSEFLNLIEFTERLNNIDAIIATGSNNSSRYFKSYFGHLPHIIRANRRSVAILTGNETKEELLGLAKDVLTFYGLGCRNISLIFIPKGFDLNLIFEPVFEKFSHLQHHKKYANNLDYNRAVFSLNKIPFIENGILILQNKKDLSPPVSVLNYWEYDSIKELEEFIENNNEQIQCISGKNNRICNTLLGMTQMPKIENFADNVNTLRFLKEL